MTTSHTTIIDEHSLNDHIIQKIGYREAVVHATMCHLYRQEQEQGNVFNQIWFACSFNCLAANTPYTLSELKRSMRKLERKKWIMRRHFGRYHDTFYCVLDQSIESFLILVSYESRKTYRILLKEYHYQNSFHNYILNGWFEYSMKALSEDLGMFQSELKSHLRPLKKHKLIEQKTIGIDTYFRFPE